MQNYGFYSNLPRLQAPIKADGVLFLRANHDPTSLSFNWPKGVSAEMKKNKLCNRAL